MKVFLIFPNIFLGNYLRLNIPIHSPLSLGYLGAVLRDEGHDVKIIDASAENTSLKKLVDEIQDFSPDVIGISANISTSQKAVLTAGYIKKAFPDKKLIMGGPWSTIEHKMLLNEGIADLIVIGEGETTIVELLENIDHPERWPGIAGIAYLEKGKKIKKTDAREFIEDLDSLPFPAWDLLPPSKKYNFSHRKRPFYPIMTSRGCPFDCIHCTKLIHGYKMRYRSIENVIAEIRHLKDQYNVKEIFIIDDNFTVNAKRAERILDEIIKNDFNIVFKFTNGIRADTVTNRLAKKLKLAGFYGVTLGIESGNQAIVDKIGKKLDLKAVVRAVRILRKNNFIIGGFFMIGHPYDNKSTMLQTYYFARRLDLDYPFFFKAIPFPGTKMYDIIKEHGVFLDSSESSAHEGYIIKSANFEIWDLKAKDIEKAFQLAYRLFYIRPWKIIKLISQLRSFSEVWWLLSSFIKGILNILF